MLLAQRPEAPEPAANGKCRVQNSVAIKGVESREPTAVPSALDAFGDLSDEPRRDADGNDVNFAEVHRGFGRAEADLQRDERARVIGDDCRLCRLAGVAVETAGDVDQILSSATKPACSKW